MIDPVAINAVREYLSAIPGLPTIIWPNEAVDISPPFLTFDFGVETGETVTLDGLERIVWRPVIKSFVEAGTFTAAQDDILWPIALAFKINTWISSSGTQYALSLRTPEVQNGANDGVLFSRDLILRLAVNQKL